MNRLLVVGLGKCGLFIRFFFSRKMYSKFQQETPGTHAPPQAVAPPALALGVRDLWEGQWMRLSFYNLLTLFRHDRKISFRGHCPDFLFGWRDRLSPSVMGTSRLDPSGVGTLPSDPHVLVFMLLCDLFPLSDRGRSPDWMNRMWPRWWNDPSEVRAQWGSGFSLGCPLSGSFWGEAGCHIVRHRKSRSNIFSSLFSELRRKSATAAYITWKRKHIFLFIF